MTKMDYKFNFDPSAKDIADLRESVGWSRMESCYENPLMVSFFSISCFEKNKLIGYVNVVSNGVTDAYIQDLMVRPEYQGKGIGTTLMNMTISELKNKHVYMTSVVFDEKLLAFYRRFGFYIMMSGQMETYM